MVDNYVEIGNIVYIGGLFGDCFAGINNKIGIVKKIVFSSSHNYTTYIVDVLLINGKIATVNMSYLFKLNDFVKFKYHSNLTNENILEFYFKKFNVVGEPQLLIDDIGKSYLYCRTRENNMQPLLLTNLN